MEDPGIKGSIILRWIFRKWDEGMDWSDVAQDRDCWRALMKVVMNLRGFHKILGISSLAEKRFASPEGLCSME